MKTRLPAFLAMVVLLGGMTPALAAKPAADPPKSSPLPKLKVSTMLFLMLGYSGSSAETADPIDINAFDIDFGDDTSSSSMEMIDEMLQGK